MKITIVAPLIAVVAIIIKLAFGINLNEDVQKQLVDVVTSVVSVSLVIDGIFRNHKKEVDNTSKK